MVLAGCSGPDVVNALVSDAGYTIVKDLAYGEGSRRTLDLYVPSGAKDGMPTVIFFYGGSWKDGSKDDYNFVGQALASRGYQVAVPDYRLYPEVRFPAFLEDSAAAVAWARTNLGVHGATPGPIYLAGHSAGAYNAVMLTLDDRWLGAHNLRPCDAIAGAAGLAGPYDFLPLKSSSLKSIFGPKDQRQRTQPINYVDGKAPPMLLASGLDDGTVYPRNSRRLAAKVQANGGSAETAYYEDIGHIWLVGSLASPFRHLAPVLDDMDGFFKRHPTPRGCNG
jgi:acetyl esterase/lipase